MDPNKVAKRFVDACMEKDFNAFEAYCQISWNDRFGSREKMEHVMQRFSLIRWVAEEVKIINQTPVSCDVKIGVKLDHVKSGVLMLKMKLIRELEPFKTDPKGNWGVNPNSLEIE